MLRVPGSNPASDRDLMKINSFSEAVSNVGKSSSTTYWIIIKIRVRKPRHEKKKRKKASFGFRKPSSDGHSTQDWSKVVEYIFSLIVFGILIMCKFDEKI